MKAFEIEKFLGDFVFSGASSLNVLHFYMKVNQIIVIVLNYKSISYKKNM